MEGKATDASPGRCSGEHVILSSEFCHQNGDCSHSTPTDFILFHKLKSTSYGRMFDAVVEIKVNSLRDLKAIPKHAFRDCFEN